jgi:hypothetical protein
LCKWRRCAPRRERWLEERLKFASEPIGSTPLERRRFVRMVSFALLGHPDRTCPSANMTPITAG